MATKSNLDLKALEALGKARLAQLLLEISQDDAALKRRLRLELVAHESPKKLAHEVRKRLQTLKRSTSYVEWTGLKALKADLETQRRLITTQITEVDPKDAYDLMWSFVELATTVFGRTDDGSGSLIEIFHQAVSDLGIIALKAKPDIIEIADRTTEALLNNDYGQYDELLAALKPALGKTGLSHIKTRFTAMSDEPAPPKPKTRRIMALSSQGPIYEDEYQERSKRNTIRYVLQDLADALGDVDAYIAQQAQYRHVPAIAAEIARRLLEAGRLEEALSAIDAPASNPSSRAHVPVEWENTRIDILEALGRQSEAQAFRLELFQTSLNADHLRAYLKRLPDFEDVEVEDSAMAHALGFKDAHLGLHFLIHWPSLEIAARLITEREAELDGNYYELLTVTADRIEAKYPLAATLVLRKMIDFALEKVRTKRYPHAARHLGTCEHLAPRIADYKGRAPHNDYAAALRLKHSRKTGFWAHTR